jgi:uncharacterized protein YndB with AHSA1/START domain
MTCDPFGEIAGEVVEADPPRRLCVAWAASFGATVVSFDLAPVADGTRLTVTHSGWAASAEAEAARNQFESGWNGKLRAGLATVLAV